MVERDIIIHAHIFKNAGSTFDHTLKQNFADNFIEHREDHLVRSNAGFLHQFLNANPKVQAFSSHSIYHFPQSTDSLHLHSVYFLRHPIERIRSVYNFEKKQPEDASSGAAMAKKMNFKEYVDWRMQDSSPATIRNLQTIFLAGIGHVGMKRHNIAELAMANLEKTPMHGVVDRYDESMIVLEDYLAPYFPQIDLSYVRRNVTDTDFDTSVEVKSQRLLDELPTDLARAVQEKNQLDMTLYQKANELLDQKLAAIADVGQRLAEFKERCRRRAS